MTGWAQNFNTGYDIMDITGRLRELDNKGYQPMTGAIGAEAVEKIEQLSAVGQLLALELECLLLAMKDTAASSKWWDYAHAALEQWRQLRSAESLSTDGFGTAVPPAPTFGETEK